MKVTLSLNDDLAEALQKEAFGRRIGLADLLIERLETAAPLDPRKRFVIILDQLQELERLLGGGHILGAIDLVAKVRRLASIEFGAHRFELTAGQLEELKYRAMKTSRTVDQLLQDLYTRMAQDLFRTVA